MIWYPLALLFVTHSLAVQSPSYVDNNPYYSFLRTNAITPQIAQWQALLQSFMQQFQQSLNFMPTIPYPVWQPQFPVVYPQVPVVSQQTGLIDIVQRRQFDIFNLLRCVVEVQPRETCLNLLDRYKKLYPPSVLINWPPVVEHLPVVTHKPMEIKPVIEEKPVVTTTEVKPVIPEVKPVHEVKPIISEVQPVHEVQPVISEVQPVHEVKPVISEVKPVHTETSVIKGPGGLQTTITETKLPHGQAISVSSVSGDKFPGHVGFPFGAAPMKNFFGKMFEKSL